MTIADLAPPQGVWHSTAPGAGQSGRKWQESVFPHSRYVMLLKKMANPVRYPRYNGSQSELLSSIEGR